MTMTAAAMTIGAAAQDGVSSKHADGFMAIHMDNQKIGSAVTAYWAAQTAIGTATTVASAPAEEKATWELRTDSAYLTVYAHYCAPTFQDLAAMMAEPNGSRS